MVPKWELEHLAKGLLLIQNLHPLREPKLKGD